MQGNGHQKGIKKTPIATEYIPTINGETGPAA